MYYKIKSKDLIIFHQHVALLLRANLPLLLSLSTILNSSQHLKLNTLLKNIIATVESGYTYAHALKQYPNYFSPWICALIHVGEHSGQLTEMLELITSHLIRQAKLKQEIKNKLRYPLLLIFCVFFSLLFFSYIILPEFNQLFNQFHTELPWLSQLLLHIAPHIPFILFLSLFLLLLYKGIYSFFYLRTASFAEMHDLFILKLPSIGFFFKLHLSIQFTETLSMTLHAGFPVFESLQLIAAEYHEGLYKQSLLRLSRVIRQGNTLESALKDHSIFLPIIQQWIHIGEESGMLSQLLQQLSVYLTEQLKEHLSVLIQSIEPVLIFSIGILISILLIGLYLPMMQLGELF